MYKDYKYGLISEVPFPEENQVDYLAKFVKKTAGQFLNCKYKYPGNEKQTQLRLAIYPKEDVEFIKKEVIIAFLNDALKYIHFDSKNLDKTLEYNSKNMKDFHNELFKKTDLVD
jgi:hypothetical protein